MLNSGKDSTEFGVVMASSDLPRSQPTKKSKSRNGCITCKLKRLKCDELKPYCTNCLKKKIECGGYATRFKWRSFNDGKEPSTPMGTSTSSLIEPATPKSSDGHVLIHLSLRQHMRQPLILLNPKVKRELDDKPLLLEDHLELASLSVVGKSTKDIKMENELLSKGINPETYIHRPLLDEHSSKKMRRSFSSNEIVSSRRSTTLQRSSSTSSHTVSGDINALREQYRKSSALESLAEAAVDEIKSRSPGALPADSLAQNHSYFNFEKTPKLTSVATPKEWTFNGPMPTASEIPTPNGKDSMSDLNLTPSLTALINYVFTNDENNRDVMDPNFIRLGGLGEVPLSPLDLTVSGQSFEPRSPRDLPIGRSIHSSALVPQDGAPSLLFEVGDQLIKYEPPSPSIISDISTLSLMRTAEYEQILFLYSTYTCGIMSIKAGILENPWRNIFLPLATEYSYLFNSIASMTLFHLAGNAKLSEKSAGLRSKGYFYMKKCILELASGLSKMEKNVSCENHLPADIALATCLNLAVSESWDTHTSSGIAHLKGAKSMIQKVLTLIRQYVASSKKKSVDFNLRKKLVLVGNDEWKKIEEIGALADGQRQLAPTEFYIPKNLQLLFNQWIYFEVMSQMTSYSGQDEKGVDLVATITKILQTTQEKRSVESMASDKSDSLIHSDDLSVPSGQGFNFFENLDTMLNNNDYVDPLLGCAQSLFLIMGRVASLISKVWKAREKDKKSTRNSLINISLASELKQQLVDWKPNISTNVAKMGNSQLDDSTWDMYSCVSTAEAYRYAALLYLHQAVPEVPLLPSHQLAEKIFVLLASIPTTSNVHIIHIFPLLVSSCEAEPGEERDWCEQRWALLSSRIWIGNIDRAFEVVKEVWRRKDDHARKVKRELDENTFASNVDLEDPRNISVHISGLMASIKSDNADEQKGITSSLHWSSVMREWGWEVLLA